MADLLERLQQALVSRYGIERELGRGGMATVCLSKDLKSRRLAAGVVALGLCLSSCAHLGSVGGVPNPGRYAVDSLTVALWHFSEPFTASHAADSGPLRLRAIPIESQSIGVTLGRSDRARQFAGDCGLVVMEPGELRHVSEFSIEAAVRSPATGVICACWNLDGPEGRWVFSIDSSAGLAFTYWPSNSPLTETVMAPVELDPGWHDVALHLGAESVVFVVDDIHVLTMPRHGGRTLRPYKGAMTIGCVASTPQPRLQGEYQLDKVTGALAGVLDELKFSRKRADQR